MIGSYAAVVMRRERINKVTKPSILIIDKHSDWLTSAKVILTNLYNVSLLNDITSLKKILETNNYDLVLVSAELIGSTHPLFVESTTIIVLTSHFPFGPQSVQECRMAFKWGAKDVIEIPLSKGDLLAKVQKLLEVYVH